MAMARLFGALL